MGSYQAKENKSKNSNRDEVNENISASGIASQSSNEACFGAGCYWGTEKYFKYNFVNKFKTLGTIIDGKVGFMGPETAVKNPTYEQVCSGRTGHVEVYQFKYTGGPKYYEAAVRYFFQFHDPTTMNRQGNDSGTQYASVIYCSDEEQVAIATNVKNELQKLLNEGKLKCFTGKKVTTDIRLRTKFYPAHDAHQDYLKSNPFGYCNHSMRFNDWP